MPVCHCCERIQIIDAAGVNGRLLTRALNDASGALGTLVAVALNHRDTASNTSLMLRRDAQLRRARLTMFKFALRLIGWRAV